LIALILTGYGIWQSYDGQKPPTIGDNTPGSSVSGMSAPNFSLRDINGTEIELNEFKGEIIGIHFMAVGCGGQIYPINQYQLSMINQAYADLKKQGVAFLTVAVATCESSGLEQLRNDYGVNWVFGNDYEDGALEIINSYTPFSIGDGAVVLIDKDFKIAEVYNGGVTSDQLSAKINELSGA
jgi:peroxiredoxin